MAVLAFSREHQSGSVDIGQAVARELGYEFVDRHGFYARLRAIGETWGRLAEELDEERPTLWEKYDVQYRAFVALMEAAVYETAANDRAVILGRGSVFLLSDIPHVLKVRLVAPMEVRVQRRMRQFDEDWQTAEAYVRRTDISRRGYIHAIYGKQLKDGGNYDLIYNTGIQTFEQVTRNLVEVLKKWDLRATPEGRQRLKDRTLAARIKARILTHPDVFIPFLDVFPDGPSIVVKGVVHTPEEYRRIREIIHESAGFHPIRDELHYRR
jgi:cytidylate kinase